MEKGDRYYREYLSHRYVSRRGLFRAFVSASRHREPEPDNGLARTPLPPGAVPAPLFYQRCDRCQQCVKACAMGVLVMDQDGYPQLAIDYASCDGCQQCSAQCPRGALVPQARFDTGLRPSVSAACITRQRHCTSCLDHCPTQAYILGDNGLPQVDSERCNGCGECLIQCDTHAITLAPVSRSLT